MQYIVENMEEYFEALPVDRVEGLKKLYEILKHNLPKGFKEKIIYGHIGFVVPFSLYPKGYHCDNKQPLPFISIASQKNHIAIYHMGIYLQPKLLNWFENEFPKYSKKKLNMGKSCIRFSKVQDIPFDLIADLAKKQTVEEYINLYESLLKPKI